MKFLAARFCKLSVSRPLSNEQASPIGITLVPYFAWGNRSHTDIEVWIPRGGSGTRYFNSRLRISICILHCLPWYALDIGLRSLSSHVLLWRDTGNVYRAKSQFFYHFWRNIEIYITPKLKLFHTFGVI